MPLNFRMPLGVTAVMLPELDFDEQLALCQSLGVTHYVFRPRYIPDEQRSKPYSNWGNHKFDLTPERLIEEGPALRAKVEAAGMTPFGTIPRADAGAPDDELAMHVQGAAAAGCANLRLTPPPYPKGLFDYPAYLEQALDRYRAAVEIAAPQGIKIVIEMHAKTAAASPGLAYNIVRHFDPQQLGLIMDLPNFVIEGELDPALAVSVVADWIDHCHFGGTRTLAGGYDAYGFRQRAHQSCAITESDLAIPQWLRTLAKLDREVPLVIENYTANMTGALRLSTTVEPTRRLLTQLARESTE